MPPNDYNYSVMIVFYDGFETISNGGTVHDDNSIVDSQIIYWKPINKDKT